MIFEPVVAVETGLCYDHTDLARHEPKYMSVKLTIVGCSPAWPNPGGAQSGYLLEGPGRLLLDCGPGVLARLREAESWPKLDAIAITHWHLDHWGDLVPWVWGATLGPGQDVERAELWFPPQGRELLASIGAPDRAAGDVRGGFRDARVRGVRAVRGGRLRGHGRTGSSTTTSSRSASAPRQTEPWSAYSGDSGPSEEWPSCARDADLFVCEATLLSPNPEGGLRGHLSAEEAVAAFEASGAKRLLLTHRPFQRPLDGTFEQAYDGQKLEIVPGG